MSRAPGSTARALARDRRPAHPEQRRPPRPRSRPTTLLANSTTAGSYRSVLGLGTDPAGLTSLRAWRSQTNANIVTAASLKGLADLLISLVQLDIVQARETRRLARQVLRLTRVQTGDLSSADVGDDTA